ncbi:hypothetical protein ACE1OC_19450 [Streptomyces sp. DSM 116496]|uniref:hypothetical protein n=1 Tax=Streptomyces stoeckheimensis TaxID=3344656 RepID=UPI0038B342FA
MYLVNTRLVAGVDPLSRTRLRELLLEAADTADGLEHVYVQTDPAGADVTLFLLGTSLAAAERSALRIHTALLTSRPELRGWLLTRCGADLVAALAGPALLGDAGSGGKALPGQDPDSSER